MKAIKPWKVTINMLGCQIDAKISPADTFLEDGTLKIEYASRGDKHLKNNDFDKVHDYLIREGFMEEAREMFRQ